MVDSLYVGGVNMDGDVNKVVKILKEHRKGGLTFADVMRISKLSRYRVAKVFDELEDSGKLCVKSDGLSRIYSLKK